MHKKGSNKHSKSKSNTLHFSGRNSFKNKFKKYKNNHSNSHSKNTKNSYQPNESNMSKNHHSHSNSTITDHSEHITHNNINNNSNSIQFKLPPLGQLSNNSNNLYHTTSPSASTNISFTQKYNKLDTSTISISSDNTNASNYQFISQIPHSPSASYSFSETNNSSTNPDFIVMIEPQTHGNYSHTSHTSHTHGTGQQHHNTISNPPLNFHQQKHFLPISNHSNHNHNNMNRPHSTSQIKSFKFDDNVMSHIQITNNISNVSNQSNQSMHSNKHISKTNNITPNTPQTQQSQPQLPSPSPTQQSVISQLSLISQTERFQQLQPDPSSTQMTPTPSPSAPNWQSPMQVSMHPISLTSTSNTAIETDNLELTSNASSHTPPKPRKYGSRSHLIDEKDEDETTSNNGKRDSIKNVKIGQTSMHPYRVYNEANILDNKNETSNNLLDKPLNSVNSISSAISIETQNSISRSFDNGLSNSYNPLPQNYGNYKCNKITTAHTENDTYTENRTDIKKKEKLKNIRIKLTPTTSTPIKSPHNNNLHLHNTRNNARQNNRYNNVRWQTYIGHFVFHEHDRGHSLYHQFKKIGEGIFARVYKTIRKEPQRTVALKVFPKKNRYAEGSFANELMLLHGVSHPNIIKLYDAHVDPKYFYLEMEVCCGGDIFKHISRKGRIDERSTRQIIYKIVDAIRCFHERDFVHRDLKPENIVFVHQNDISDIRLIDFGESIHIEPQGYYNEFVGTPCYFAPERFRQHTGAELKKCDVWAIGVIMFEMLTGCRCFKGGDNTWEVKNNILSKKLEQWPNDLILSSNAMDFFHKLLEYEPLKRYSCQQALRHDWLYDIFQSNQQQQQQQQHQHQSFMNYNRFHVSPRLTPVSQNKTMTNQSIESMQAIVIKTSQSMTNLQNIKNAFQQQIDNRKYGLNNHRKHHKIIERKYNDNDNNNDNNDDDDDNDDNDDDDDNSGSGVPWKLRITRKKSRSLEQNELRATLRNKDGSSAFHRLTLPKHSDKYRIKNRSHTLGSTNIKPIAIKKQKQKQEENEEKKDIEMIENDDKNDNKNDTPFHTLKHEKSLSSPAMNVTINKYHPSPVHEDYDSNDWRHTNTSSQETNDHFGNQSSVSYSLNQNNINHEKNNSFSINSNISFVDYNID